MRVIRFRLRSLMILVLVSALGLAAFIPISKVNLNEINDLKPRVFLLGSFFLLVVAKLGLLIGTRAARHRSELSSDRGPSADSNGGSASS